jgi:hypothetical protein
MDMMIILEPQSKAMVARKILQCFHTLTARAGSCLLDSTSTSGLVLTLHDPV